MTHNPDDGFISAEPGNQCPGAVQISDTLTNGDGELVCVCYHDAVHVRKNDFTFISPAAQVVGNVVGAVPVGPFDIRGHPFQFRK